jgi:hypothetical protein
LDTPQFSAGGGMQPEGIGASQAHNDRTDHVAGPLHQGQQAARIGSTSLSDHGDVPAGFAENTPMAQSSAAVVANGKEEGQRQHGGAARGDSEITTKAAILAGMAQSVLTTAAAGEAAKPIFQLST